LPLKSKSFLINRDKNFSKNPKNESKDSINSANFKDLKMCFLELEKKNSQYISKKSKNKGSSKKKTSKRNIQIQIQEEEIEEEEEQEEHEEHQEGLSVNAELVDSSRDTVKKSKIKNNSKINFENENCNENTAKNLNYESKSVNPLGHSFIVCF
jgi:hypothetical protein